MSDYAGWVLCVTKITGRQTDHKLFKRYTPIFGC